MSDLHTNPYVALLVLFGAAVIFSLIFVNLSRIFGRSKPELEKTDVYECGVPPTGTARVRISVKFYMVALLFILFDLEAVFVYPWAISVRRFADAGYGVFVLVEMLLFLGLLFCGWLYVWKRGALKWE